MHMSVLLESHTLSSPWYPEKAHIPRKFCSRVPVHNDEWSWVGLGSLGNQLFSKDTGNSHLFSLLHPGASGKRDSAHLKYTDEKRWSLTTWCVTQSVIMCQKEDSDFCSWSSVKSLSLVEVIQCVGKKKSQNTWVSLMSFLLKYTNIVRNCFYGASLLDSIIYPLLQRRATESEGTQATCHKSENISGLEFWPPGKRRFSKKLS